MRQPSSARLWESPIDACRETVREKVILEGRTYHLIRPASSDPLLDHAVTQTASVADDYVPYWTDLWPCARMLGKALLREQWRENLRVLEIGCGLGLPGIVALSLGMRVTFSDYDLTALQFAERNARANGFDRFELLPMDWRCPPEDLKVDLLLAADVIYEERNVEPIVRLIQRLLTDGGLCLLADQDRMPAESFRQAAVGAGLQFTRNLIRAGQPGGRREKGTLYRIRRAAVPS